MPLMLFSLLIAAPLLSLTDGVAVAAQPEPWQLGFQPAATSVMERIASLHDLSAVDHRSDLALRPGAPRLGLRALSRIPQHHAFPAHAQYGARDRLDGGAGPDPRADRDPVVQALVLPGRGPGGRAHDQGDRTSVVLELRVSRQWQLRFRCLSGGRRRSPAWSTAPSDHRQSRGAAGRYRPSASWSPRPTSSTPGPCRRSGSRRTRCPGGSTRPGCGSTSRAPITDNVPSCAVTITASCRSWSRR